MKTVTVVGGGAFGTTAAWMLARAGHRVTLVERLPDILGAASAINQYRLHRGYHYPRSDDTARSSIEGQISFGREYGAAVVRGRSHYYAVAREGSLVDAEAYLAFCDRVGLSWRREMSPVLRPETVQLSVLAEESLFDPDRLRETIRAKLAEHGVRIEHREFRGAEREEGDHLVYALYAGNNAPFRDRPELRRAYQFELCEKPVVRPSAAYRGVSTVLMDGPFMCVDPLADGTFSVLGNVTHAIHARTVEAEPTPPVEYRSLLDQGVVADPSPSAYPKFASHMAEYLAHVGSMYTYRTVLPNRDADDARPTLVERVTDREIRLFSGKIGTCVDAAEAVVRLVAG